MRLITAHRILIGTAVVFFLGFAMWEFMRAGENGDFWGLARAVLYLAVAAGFTVYLKKLKNWVR